MQLFKDVTHVKTSNTISWTLSGIIESRGDRKDCRLPPTANKIRRMTNL